MDIDSGDLSEGFGSIREAAKPLAPFIALGVLVAAAVLIYLFAVPRPASLTVTISALDGGAVSSSIEVYLTDASGNAVGGAAGTVVAQNGQAFFASLPSNTPIYVNVDAGSGYVTQSQQVTLPSGGSQSLQVALEAANQLSIAQDNLPSSMTQGCTDSFYVDVLNNGTSPFTAQLIAQGDPALLSSFNLGGPQAIPAGSTSRFYINVSLPSGTGYQATAAPASTLSFRIKGTQVGFSVPVTITPQVSPQLSPQSIQIQDTNSMVYQMTLSNPSTAPLSNFQLSFYPDSGLSAACGADGSGCFSVNLLSNAGLTTLPPNSQISFEFDDKGITGLNPGTYLGQLVLTADCLKSPGVSTNVNVNIASQPS